MPASLYQSLDTHTHSRKHTNSPPLHTSYIFSPPLLHFLSWVSSAFSSHFLTFLHFLLSHFLFLFTLSFDLSPYLFLVSSSFTLIYPLFLSLIVAFFLLRFLSPFSSSSLCTSYSPLSCAFFSHIIFYVLVLVFFLLIPFLFFLFLLLFLLL